MTLSISARLIKALDTPEIPKHIQVRVHNQVCGPNAEDPPSVAWQVLYDTVNHHLKNLRSNKAKVPAYLMPAWQEYYDAVSSIPSQIRASDWNELPPRHLSKWQGWVPKEQREAISQRFAVAYDGSVTQGSRMIPFAPREYQQANAERLNRSFTALYSARATWNTRGTPDNPRSHLHLGAVILAACRQAEIQMERYRKALKERKVHPYEEPAKVKWQDYCEAETRAKVRRLTENSADLYFDFTPYEPFYSPVTP